MPTGTTNWDPPTPAPEPAGNWWSRLSTKGKVGTGIGAFVALSVVLGATGVLDEDDANADTTTTEQTVPVTTESPVVTEAPATGNAPVVEDTAPAATRADAEEAALMPDVVGMDLQAAQDTIQEVGVFHSRSEDATGQGRMQVWDRNWVVVSQDPQPGTPIGEGDALLYVVKDDEL